MTISVLTAGDRSGSFVQPSQRFRPPADLDPLYICYLRERTKNAFPRMTSLYVRFSARSHAPLPKKPWLFQCILFQATCLCEMSLMSPLKWLHIGTKGVNYAGENYWSTIMHQSFALASQLYFLYCRTLHFEQKYEYFSINCDRLRDRHQ